MEETKKVRVAINGLGRIGRAFFKLAIERPEIEMVAVNDLGNIENLLYLLKYDTVYGEAEFDISIDDNHFVVEALMDDSLGTQRIPILNEMDPKKLPWGDMNVDVVVESTGVFTSYEKASMHKEAGAKKVVISAPAKDAENEGTLGETVLMGVNHDKLNSCDISSNGSCTTNAGSPLIAILKEAIGIEKAMLNTVHGYTATQSIVDGPVRGSDFRKGRAAAQNIIPTSTGAAIAVTKALPELKDKFDGIAMRVPVVAGSIADITFIAKKDTTVEEVNEALKKAAESERWQGIFTVTDEPVVSSDILGHPHASIADLSMTRVVDGNLVKVLAWYDNEMGYTHTLVDHVITTGQAIK